MKFEFSMTSKVNPVADVNISVDCSAEELGIILSDPVYRELGKALISKLSTNRGNDRSSNRPNQDRFDHFRRYMEADVKALQNADRITNRRVDILSKRIDQLFDHVIKQ